MKTMKRIMKIVALGVAGMLSIGLLGGCTVNVDGQKMNADAVSQAIADATEAATQAGMDAGIASVDVTADNVDAVKEALTNAGLEVETIDELKDKVTGYEQIIADYEAAEVVEEAEQTSGLNLDGDVWISDEININSLFSADLTDRKVVKLFDNEIEFDGDDYDAEEVLELNGLKIVNNGVDFAENVYLEVPENGIVYKFIIENGLNTDDIGADETLEITLLGQDIEIVDWNETDNEITLAKGEQYTFAEGETQTIDGKEISVRAIGDDNDGSYVFVMVGTESDKIYEDGTKTINGMEIEIKDVIIPHSLNTEAFATLKVGEDVLITIENGDEYEEDSIWDWVIGANEIGLTLNDNFDSLDDRNGNDILDVGKSISLPNNYLTISFDGLEDEDIEKYTFELDGSVVVIEGKFINGINDYDEIFVNGTEMYSDEDDVGNTSLAITTEVFLGDSKINITTDGTNIVIDDISIALTLSTINVGTTNISGAEDNYRTDYGIIIETPEDAVDDQEIVIEVPEEELYGTIRVG